MLPRHDAPASGSDRVPVDGAIASPPARRTRHRRWRDPRLWLGAVLVLGSVVAGARVMATADDTVAVWQLAHDVPAGAPVRSGDLRSTSVHFDEPSAANQYVLASRALDPRARATRDLHTGELLAVAAVASGPQPVTRQVPLGVGPAHQPADLHPGDRVDVWAVRSAAGGGPGEGPEPDLVLHDVSVLSVGTGSGLTGDRQVLIGVGPAVDVGTVLRRTTGAQVVLVRLAS